MHTWLGGEQPSSTYVALSSFLGYVQVKDIASADDTTPLPLGSGVLPLTECVDLALPRGLGRLAVLGVREAVVRAGPADRGGCWVRAGSTWEGC
ncbi:sugar phosphate isomerase/epimerase [Streptomyces sp. V4I2]|nr:sugar phosphate isomerase/epimerase [Streptomyces sp. V4I2]